MEILTVSLRATILTLVLTGIAYPLLVTGLAQTIFPRQANGSLVADRGGRAIGSELIGQGFSRPVYFTGRLSAAGPKGWDAAASGGSNLAVTSRKLRERVDHDVRALGGAETPDDLVTTSGSGLDPDISPAAARWQIARVARARGVDEARVATIVDAQIEGRQLGMLGEARVNVLLLNLALDAQLGVP